MRTTNPIGYHVMMRLDDDRVILRDTRERRIAARIFHRLAHGSRLFHFGGGDTHMHFNTAGSHAEAGRLIQRAGASLVLRLGHGVGFLPATRRPINDQRHGYNLFPYQINQAAHHGYEQDPLYEATTLLDFVGMRVGGEHIVRLAMDLFPRLRPEELAERAGFPTAAPLDLSEVDGVELIDLTDVLASVLTAPTLEGRRTCLVGARAAAVSVLPGVRTDELAARLGCCRQSIARYRSIEPRPELVRAVALQLVARVAIQQRGREADARLVAFAGGRPAA